MTDVFNQSEGSLSWVSASGNSNAWLTAASSPSGTAVAFVTDFNFTSAQTINTVMNRGTPNHHKTTSRQPLNVSLSYLYTGAVGVPNYPVHLELKSTQGTTSAFHIFLNCIKTQKQFNEAAESDNFADTFVALGCIESTASGYLSH